MNTRERSDKNLKIVHQGTAVAGEHGVWRLRDLLAADRLGPGVRRVASAHWTDTGQISLVFEDGEQLHVGPPTAPRPEAAPLDLVVRNAGQVLTMEGEGVGLRPRAVVGARDGRIVGVWDAPPDLELAPDALEIDAGGGVVSPGLVDPHTHPVFAGERSVEFGMKAEGRSYLEIHKAGGGILSTVRATREASFEQLMENCAANLSRLLRWGVTTCEGKSGYALQTEGELRLLEVLRAVGNAHPVEVEPTLLGAHALPPEYRARRQDYVAMVIEEMIPRAAARDLARFCDAYCEDGAFDAAEVRAIFNAAREAGLGLRLHAEQFTDQGGALLAAELGAASADHLEAIDERAIAAMARAGTVAVLLPGAAVSCRCPWPPARQLIEAGVPVALGTDLNPGSSMTAALPLMMSLACMQLGLCCEAAWRAVTVVAAQSLGRSDLGRIIPGARADLVIFDAPDYRYVPYHYGDNHARVVIKSGRVVVRRD